jgi:hypothetical protein
VPWCSASTRLDNNASIVNTSVTRHHIVPRTVLNHLSYAPLSLYQFYNLPPKTIPVFLVQFLPHLKSSHLPPIYVSRVRRHGQDPGGHRYRFISILVRVLSVSLSTLFLLYCCVCFCTISCFFPSAVSVSFPASFLLLFLFLFLLLLSFCCFSSRSRLS